MLKKEDLSRNGTVGFQVFTEVSPDHLSGQRPRDREESSEMAQEMARALKPMIRERLQGGATLAEVMDSLTREGLITNSDGLDLTLVSCSKRMATT